MLKIGIGDMIYFTSDNHFFHHNILKKFCVGTRQGKDVNEMNELMIRRWNEVVQPTDHVYSLGDFSFGRLEETVNVVRRLNGHKHLIWGNHDQVIKNNIHRFNGANDGMFESFHDYLEMTIEGHHVVLFHFPIYEWNKMHRGAFHLYGHIHSPYGYLENPAVTGRAMDVGIDSRPQGDMTLWPWYDVRKILEKRDIRQHHEKKGDL